MRECIVYMVMLPPIFTFIKLVHLFFKNHTSHQGKIYNIFTVVNNIHNQKNKIYGVKTKILYSVLLVTLKILLGMPKVLHITLKILLAIVKFQCPTILAQIYISPILYRMMFSLNKIRKVWVFLGDFHWEVVEM